MFRYSAAYSTHSSRDRSLHQYANSPFLGTLYNLNKSVIFCKHIGPKWNSKEATNGQSSILGKPFESPTSTIICRWVFAAVVPPVEVNSEVQRQSESGEVTQVKENNPPVCYRLWTTVHVGKFSTRRTRSRGIARCAPSWSSTITTSIGARWSGLA